MLYDLCSAHVVANTLKLGEFLIDSLVGSLWIERQDHVDVDIISNVWCGQWMWLWILDDAEIMMSDNVSFIFVVDNNLILSI